MGGGFGHFYAYAPSKMEYPIDRFAMEVKRQLDVRDQHLAHDNYLVGDDYRIADIAVWPWYGALAKAQLYRAGDFLDVASYTHVLRWADQIAQRPAAKRGPRVNRAWGPLETQLHERHEASDFDTQTEDRKSAPEASIQKLNPVVAQKVSVHAALPVDARGQLRWLG